MKKTKEPTLRIVITAIVTVILILVILLLIRNFKYTPSKANALSKDIKALQNMSETYNAGLVKDLNEKKEALEEIKTAQTTNYNNTTHNIRNAQNTIVNKINDSNKDLSEKIKAAEEAVNKNVDEAEEAINDNVDHTRHSVNSNINYNAYVINANLDYARRVISRDIENARVSLSGKIDTSKDEIKAKINSSKDEIKAKINGAKESIVNEINDAKDEVNANTDAAKDEINDNIADATQSINSTIAFTSMWTNFMMDTRFNQVDQNIANLSRDLQNAKDEVMDNTDAARDAVNANTDAAKTEVKGKIDSSKDEIKAKINSSKDEVKAKINGAKETIVSEISDAKDEVNEKIDDLSLVMTRRFNQVDESLEDLASDLEADKNEIVGAIATKAGELSDSIDAVSGNLADLFDYVEEINDNKLGSFDDGSTVYSKLFNLGTMVYKLNQKADKANTDLESIKASIGTYSDATTDETLFGLNQLTLEKVKNVGSMVHQTYTNLNETTQTINSLSTIIGTQTDTSADNTLFGKTTLLLEKVQNVGNMLYTINTNVNAANGKLDTIITKLDETPSTPATLEITDSVLQQVYTEVGANGNAQAKISQAIEWLKAHNYAR